MVYLPLGLDGALALRSGGPPVSGRAFAATASLRRALEVDADVEAADFAALSAAAVAALDARPVRRRLVLAADVPAGSVQDRGDDLGSVEVTGLAWAHVRSLFADEEAAADAVEAASAAASQLGPADAWDQPAVVRLTDTFDLLWFDPGELDALA